MSTPTNEQTPTEESSSTSFDLVYQDVSKVTASEESNALSLAAEASRSPVQFHGRIKDPIKIRETLSALYSVVASDMRYKPRDRSAYVAYLRMKKETATLSVWQAQQAYFSWLAQNDPSAFLVLDPIITVHPDRICLEVFSKDESTYVNLSIDRDLFDEQKEVKHGTTNIDFSSTLFAGLQQMRGYRKTEFHIGQGGFGVSTSSEKNLIEKKIPLPDSWLRGLLQVQSAATLPMEKVTLAPIDFYNLLRELRLHADIKKKKRGLLVELVPYSKPRFILEPWETVVESSAATYHGKAPRAIRIWGRRRLMLIQRFLPFIKSIEVQLLGSGLPSFWIFRGEGICLTMGLTGFTNANWSQALAFDLLLPRANQSSKSLDKLIPFLSDVWFATPQEISKQTGLKGSTLTQTLQLGCQQGLLIYDLAHGVYRYRPVSDKPLNLEKLAYRNVREKQAFDLLNRRNEVELTSENFIPLQGLELVGRVNVTEDGRDYRPMLLLGEEGNVRKAECTCPMFRKNQLKNGPCTHLIALRLIYAKIEAERKEGQEKEAIVLNETRAFSKRTEKGTESRMISLEKTQVRMKWTKPQESDRQITLRFNSEKEARTAYFAEIEKLEKKGYISFSSD
ncbi:MAG: SWIM zinc finger domain-containing protein [Gemmataceae bacterium]|jgi:hypothetical protein|nr:SWIM zinc finger domain-containing protein [Gemmataceae bacterium]